MGCQTVHALFMALSRKAAGVLRNRIGDWLMGYSHFVRVCSVDHAELWAISDGVAVMRRLGYKKVMVESDNLSMINIATTTEARDNELSLLGLI
ncbi:hypothetical protein J1N35_042828 [Gossypium stocksii]|uniref:RNase H type-1 domain-containing protein n=1 Tax=Gossypium stocksii TaxID=47602 RepID=A0A9D3U6A7_9ROSI|nr:hypothetical protein J1N35_042828 [Gossypium stocksii]